MRKFRILLTLLLCLTVPVAGWASVMSGPLCPQRTQSASSEGLAHEHGSGSELAMHADASEHHHQHGGDPAKPGKPCTGDHCACGCGIGACSASPLSLAAGFSLKLAVYVGGQSIVFINELPPAGARGASLLRPPIA